ncbi:MAG TPA: CRISPR-associated endonuclease Cas2 [Solirubrobacter sp.]|nr:CRISPR-associated endonuclease Cas2 [Solirubrobacter sp.]
MAARTRYLLTYDISDPARLRRVHQIAKQFGYALQYSVFVCDLEPVALIALREKLRATIHHREDRISIFVLGPAGTRRAEHVVHLGRGPAVLDSDEEAVW